MKAVLILALLALAANSFSLNLTAFSLGEATTVGLTEEQLQFDAIPCIQAITNDIDQGLALLETRDFLTILGGFNSWYAQFQTDFHVICQNYTNDVKEIFVSNLNLSVPVEVTIKENLKTYAPEIIQQLDFLINNITAGNDFEAGVSDVTITMILYGLTVPTVPAVTPFNASLYTIFNLSTFSSEYFPAFFAGIGNTAVVDTETLGQCLSDIETITQGIEYFIHDFRSYSVIEKIGAIITFASAGANGVESCKYGLDLYATVYGPIYEAFKAEPVKFILEVVNNMAANAPEIVQSLQQEEIYILQGQYDLAGETKADRFLTVFGFALNI